MNSTILVIEDNEQNMYMMTFMLKKHGYQVLQARDGKSGIELARREQPDLILLDMQLPVVDGYEVARRLRTLPETRNIPIVGVSSYAMVGDQEKALTAGCDGYFEKPIDPVRFMQEIEKHLGG
ncbi:MAG: response regulator [Anaerolineae bacterium]|jgi:CheY-like chemotaxis protein|nr:response regulator [Anaerolineae bacterium]MDH7475358.1 response regulator [Anaerolineae bacterium]